MFKNKILILLFVFFFSFGLIKDAFGAEYYVATTGDDNASGDVEYPWRTFKNAISDIIQPGDTIYIRGGVYSEYADIYAGDEAILPLFRYSGIHGDSDNPITYKSYPGETAIIDPQFNSDGILLQGDHITGIIIEDLEIRNSWFSGIRLEDDTSHITIRNNHIHDTDGPLGGNIGAIRMNTSHDILIENNLLHGNYIRAAQNLNGANIFIFGGTTNIFIKNNELYDSEQGVFYKHSGYGNSVFENNYLHDMRSSGFRIASDNITMKNNLLLNIEGSAFDIHSEGGCTECTRNAVIENNTVVNCGGSYLLNRGSDRPGAINTTVKNNIFYQSGGPRIWVYGSNEEFSTNYSDFHASYNNFFIDDLGFNYFGSNTWGDLGDIYSLEDFQSMGFEINSFNEDPLFVNASGHMNQVDDFELGVNSLSVYSDENSKNRGVDIAIVGINQEVVQLNIRADVNQDSQINTTDAMLALRNSLGLQMIGTAWEISATTGDANCDGSSKSTDAMLILRYSLGLDMSETDWCE